MPYIILDIAGKWFSTTEHATSTYVSVNEVTVGPTIVSGNYDYSTFTLEAPLATDIGGNVSVGDYWDLSSYGRLNLTDGSIDYASSIHFTIFLSSNDNLDTSYFNRTALEIPRNPGTVNVWVGNVSFRLPRQITAYYCDSFTVEDNLTARSNTGLTLIGTVDIPSTTTASTMFTMGTLQTATMEGTLSTGVQIGTRSKVVSGLLLPSPSTGLRSVAKQGLYLPAPIMGVRSVTKQGAYINALTPDSNAIDHVKLIVTPTNTYFGSGITVDAKNNLYGIGKYRLYMNKAIAIPFLSDFGPIDQISFPLDISLLPVGSTPCRIEYLFPDGNKEYIDFAVTKEANNRQAAVTTLYWYSGGFDITGDTQYITSDGFNSGVLATAGIGKKATIKTSSVTSIDLSHAHEIYGVNLECDELGCFFLVSFDNQVTWHSFINGVWEECTQEGIATKGMTKSVITSITKEQWDTIFQKTEFNVMVYMDNNSAVTPIPMLADEQVWSVILNKSGTKNVTYEVPEGLFITRVALYGSSDGFYKYATINYTDGSIYSFQVAYSLSIYTIPLDKEVSSIYIRTESSVSSSVILYAVNKYAWLKSLSVLFLPNYPPAVTDIDLLPPETHTDSVLSAHIKDAEGDSAYYRVSVNGEPMTENFITEGTEYDIEITIPSSMTAVGTNAITIQTFDGLTYSDAYTTYLTKVDAKPVVSGILDKLQLIALVTDDDAEDTISYRISLNGVVKVDWSNFVQPPINVRYNIRNADVNIGVQNTLTLEVQDSLGEITSVDFDFVGQLYNMKSRYSYIL
ncbi:hypothetical protein [Sporomusa sp. KB1]|uniref:hypothetical protein n=1 Tax=Sporomusa sp. KB1 TaxID=943346 RepID=UPI00119CC9BE|nr:hypothetical protein [Sporomusa sp. KB1]TWH48566.1 hypothetical protein Salpa_4731 [Sporomusa sp. KB1]